MASNSNTREFYDAFANDYHLLFANWPREVERQGEILDRVIRALTGSAAGPLLDCTCGIGTQAIGLAMRGWNVHATDLSPPALARALKEAESLGVEMKGEVADLRRLDDVVKERFAVVISCDNALSHLFDDNDLLAAARQIHGRLLPGGAFLASIRDYDRLFSDAEARVSSTGQQLPGEYSNARGGLPGATLPRVFDEGRRIVFQVWDWSDDRRSYAVHQFIVRRIGEQWETAHHEGRFRALRQRELSAALEAAGFHDISWLAPEQSGYYQPIVTAKR